MSGLDQIFPAMGQWLKEWQALVPFFLLLILGGGSVLLVQRFLRRHFNRMVSHAPISPGTLLILRRAISLSLWVVLGLLLLRQAGVNVDGIWAMLASMLAVIGVGLLAVWTMVSNITASLFIWIWRPYELGETIEMLPTNVKGRVVDRSLMFTTIREADGTLLMVPNNQFFQTITRRWPTRTRVTDYEAWEAERKFGSAEYASHQASPHPAVPDSPPKDDAAT